MDIIDLTEDGDHHDVIEILDDDDTDDVGSEKDATDGKHPEEARDKRRMSSNLPDLNSKDLKRSRIDTTTKSQNDEADGMFKSVSGHDSKSRGNDVLEHISYSENLTLNQSAGSGKDRGNDCLMARGATVTSFGDPASQPSQYGVAATVTSQDSEGDATKPGVKIEFVDDANDQRRTDVQSGSVPNFVLIDDSSDEEDGTGDDSEDGVPAVPYGPKPYKFSPETEFTFDLSAQEAQRKQEELFSQSAARMRRQQSYYRKLRNQKSGLTFTRPVEPSKLNEKHYLWPCLYARLGLPKDASEIQIRKQYRKLALRYHPDKCRLGDASIRFQAVTEAYHKLLRR